MTTRAPLSERPSAVNDYIPPGAANASRSVPKGMDQLMCTPVPIPVAPPGGLGRNWCPPASASASASASSSSKANTPATNAHQQQAHPGKENLASQGTTGKKRKSDASTSSSSDANANAKKKAKADLQLDADLSHIEVPPYIDANCDQVRRKIRAWLDGDAQTKTAFSQALGVSTKSLNNFLEQSGRDKGMGCAAYDAAWEFFKRRELAGLPMPKKPRAKAAAAAGGAGGQKGGAGGTTAAVDISDVVLPGQETDSVPVYESCDEIRKKINAHLAKPGVTQAQFCRDLLAQLNSPDKPKNIQSVQLARFRNTRGAIAGTKSPVYYASYVFFEKIRIKEGKPKSKHREEMEKIWKSAGVDLTHDSRTDYITCHVSEEFEIDQYGQLHFHKRY